MWLWIWIVNKIHEEIEMRKKWWRNNKKRGESFFEFLFMELQANNVFYYILLLSENWNWNYKRICLNEFLFERIQERWGSKRPNQDYKWFRNNCMSNSFCRKAQITFDGHSLLTPFRQRQGQWYHFERPQSVWEVVGCRDPWWLNEGERTAGE